MNIIIFGTGSSAEKFVLDLDKKKIEIKGFLDNDVDKHFKEFMGSTIFPPERILEIKYDYVFIASQYSFEIMEQLLDMGVPHNKIVPVDYAGHNQNYQSCYEEICKSIKVKKDRNREKLKIAVVNYNFSHSNGYSLFKNIPNFIKSKYIIDLISEQKIGILNDYDVICSSNHDGIYDENHINIEMWHGFPIKQMGAANEILSTDKFLNYQYKREKNIDLIMSYSQLYNVFFNACYLSNANKYRITGMPRNDLLFEEGSLDKLEKVCNKKLNDYNIVFYLPTWRKGKNCHVDSNWEWEKLIGFNDEDEAGIIRLLEENNIFLVVKLHPNEYKIYHDLNIFRHERVCLLSEEKLTSNEIHLYEILAGAKILITDYSSVYFDTLLIDLPIIFAPTDLNEYSENRGFLLEPYDYLTPGPTVFSLNEMGKEISNYINGKDRYKSEREKVKRLVFKYFDNKSSLRVWTEIDKYLSNLRHQ